MKHLLIICIIAITCIQVHAQDTQNIKAMLDAKHYIFEPRNMTTGQGRLKQLDPGYFFTISGDTLKTYLPYVGGAYTAPLDPSEAGFDFSTSDFSYTVSSGKKNSYDVIVKAKGKTAITDFMLTIYDNGTAYLKVVASDKEPVSYNGNIAGKK